jgi:hypothetical protein
VCHDVSGTHARHPPQDTVVCVEESDGTVAGWVIRFAVRLGKEMTAQSPMCKPIWGGAILPYSCVQGGGATPPPHPCAVSSEGRAHHQNKRFEACQSNTS